MNIQGNLQTSPAVQAGWLTGGADARNANLSATAGGLTGASMVESRSGNISLETMEGDRVTLSFSSQTEVTYQLYNARGGLDGGAQARLEAFTLKSGSEMSIAIEGELSDAEKADIEKVMSAVEEMAEEFFKGDVDEALAELLSMGDTGTIAGLQVSLESSRSVTISSQGGALESGPADAAAIAPPVEPSVAQDAQAPAGAQPATGTQPSAAPLAGQSAQTTAGAEPTQSAATVPAEVPADQSGRITVDTTNGLVASMTSAVGGSGVNLSVAEKHILRLLDGLFDKIADDLGFGEDKHKVAGLVKSEFADQLNEMAGQEAREADGRDNGHARGAERPEHKHGDKHGHDHGHKGERGDGHKRGH